MKKIGFISPWYGEKIPGGAEMELREVTAHLLRRGLDIEILTTCIRDFNSDWEVNYYKEQTEEIAGITVRRFPVLKRDRKSFDSINAKLMNNFPILKGEEEIFFSEMVKCPELYEYMRKNADEYDLFVFIPYLFSTTYYGVQVCPEKSVLLPCFHDEGYLYLRNAKQVYERAAGVIYNARPEYDLANSVFSFQNAEQIVMGIGMDTDIGGNAIRFRKKYDINEKYILYAGRKDEGKNIYTLLKYFSEYKRRNDNKLKLVLIGGGSVKIPEDIRNEVYDLGFVDVQDKYDAYTAAEVLCQPSLHESFSLVIMESWLCGRPVLVHEGCAVTRNFVSESNGGLYFGNYFGFEGCVNYFLTHGRETEQMGLNGKKYVEGNFSWDVIEEKYAEFFDRIIRG